LSRGTIPTAALGVIDLSNRGDGVAYVARLLLRALGDLTVAAPYVIQLGWSAGTVPMAKRISFAARLMQVQATGRIDWVVLNHLGLGRAQVAIPRLLRKPYAVVLHGIEAWDAALAADRRKVLRAADLRIAVSEHTSRRVIQAHPDIGPVVPCPLALLPDEVETGDVDTALLDALPEESVLIVGRMSAEERYKGHDQLLECWPAVTRNVPAACLVVAGRGNDVERLRRKAAELGVADRVIFAGFVSQATLRALYESVAVLAMPSRGEGFGLVYLEAMRAGTSCIGSTADAAGDIIVHGKTGFLVAPSSIPELEQRLVTLLTNGALRRSMGAEGRRRLERHFLYDHYRDRLAGILAGAFGTGPQERAPCAG
jgi:phosphatidyl-myo-inositol dimannoside synthase